MEKHIEPTQRRFPNLSEDAQHVLSLIGKGWRLRVPHPGGGGALVIDTCGEPGAWRRNPSSAVAPEIVRELHAARVLWKLTRDRIDDRLGWAERGLDGLEADWYCLVI